jgi:hypothetical protein
MVCGDIFSSLIGHISDKHNLSSNEYKTLYPDAATVSDNLHSLFSENFAGENNPGYQHGGTLSSWSSKSVKHTKEEIEISRKKAKDNYTPEKRSTNIEYWLNKGYTQEEAEEKLSERQTTFSLEICIEKLGQVEGTKRFKERQIKWHKSYKKTNYSKISQLLFWEIYDCLDKECIDDIYFAEFNNGIKSTINNEYCLDLISSTIKPDFFIKSLGKIIEFDGDYWHGTARGNQERDRLRDIEIVKSGYLVFHVKECNYKSDPARVIQECVEFLNG